MDTFYLRVAKMPLTGKVVLASEETNLALCTYAGP